MRNATIAIAALALLGSGAAAQAASDIPGPGRYDMQSAGDGVLRLDRQTGEIAYCMPAGEAWTCRPVVPSEASVADDSEPDSPVETATVTLSADPDEEPAEKIARLEAENRRLARRVALLEARLVRIEVIAGADEPTATTAAIDDGFDEAIEGIDKAVTVGAYAVKRFRSLADMLGGNEAGNEEGEGAR